MNLALRDIRHNFPRFVFTTFGIGLLLMIVMGMGGIYRGLVFDATFLVNQINADLWVVQGNTRGPFAENSRIPSNLEDRLRPVPEIARSRRFVSHTIQREHHHKTLRMTVQGLDYPNDKGEWVYLIAGRALAQAHFEMIADRSLGLALGEQVQFGKDVYRVVGLTRGMSSIAGDGLAFFSVSDAMAIQFDQPSEAVRLERAARFARSETDDTGRTQPLLLERAAGSSALISELALPQVSAILVSLQSGANTERVIKLLSAWSDITVYTAQQQRELLLSGSVDKSRRQLGLFSILLIIISTIIIALIIYTLTLDKLYDIALLKLIGARNRVIVGLILQQALLMGALGYGLAWWMGQYLFPYFPRRVLLETPDLIKLAFITVGISVLASLLGIWKALRVEPNTVLS
ncbi:MAG: ABC transporter permease [Methylococcales bacterium]|nr:ABC transporter permease [Methylococcales bacterium]